MTPERSTIDVGEPVSVLDYGGDGPLIVCVHGLEGSAYNWDLIAPTLAKTHRVVAPDLSGFGYTPPHEDGSSIEVNARLVSRVTAYYGEDALLIGNSMGGLISILAAERYRRMVNGLILIDPATPIFSLSDVRLPVAARLSIPMIPWLGGKAIDAVKDRTSVAEGVEEALAFVTAHPEELDDRVREHATEVATLRRSQPWATSALVEATTSIAPYVLRKKRFASLMHRVVQPTLLIHGDRDELVNAQAARWIGRQRPDWTVALFEDVGHVPMIEKPDRVLAVIEVWLEALSEAQATKG